MKCALTGTPGIGKTTVSDHLKKDGYEVLHLNEFIENNDLLEKKDRTRDSFNVDITDLKRTYEKKQLKHEIVEGHLSHYLSLDPTIVLRCAPTKLEERMGKKGWNEKKIKENLEVETLDTILIEAIELCDEVYEIDTTKKTPEQVAECVKEIFKGNQKKHEYEPGSIDWTEEYL